jgi:DNA primase large subunit
MSEEEYVRYAIRAWIAAYENLVVKMNEEGIAYISQNDLITIIKTMREEYANKYPDDSQS